MIHTTFQKIIVFWSIRPRWMQTVAACVLQHCGVCLLAGMFPVSGADFEALNAAVERLTLNDASVAVKRENSAALGAGFRCGYAFLNSLP